MEYQARNRWDVNAEGIQFVTHPRNGEAGQHRFSAFAQSAFRCLRFLLPLLFLLPFGIQAQDALLKKADALYREMNYEPAIKAYVKYFKQNPPRKKQLANLAECYRLTFQYDKAAATYLDLIQMPRPDAIYYYNYAKSLMNLEDYEEAKKWFLKFAEQMPEDPRGMAMADACQHVDRFRKDSAYYSVLPLPINTKESEFAPSFWSDGIVFSASRPQTTLDASDYDWNSQSYLDLYFTKVSPDGNGYSRPKSLDGSVNTPYHEATATFDREGKTVYFTRNNFLDGSTQTDEEGLNRLQIYYADLDEGEWNDIRGLPFNSNKYSVGHPCLSEQGNILYFVSDKPGGYGGTDIYLSYRREDAWSEPVNLGPTINTAGNEMFPFIHEDRTLYFASDGHPGLGGLDLYSAEFDTTWRSIRNLGYPFNTAADDFALIITDEKDHGYFSSNRPGGKGLDDLYRFRVLRPLLTGVVVRGEDDQPISDVKVIVQVSGEEEKRVIYTSPEGKFSQLLEYDQDYRIIAEKEGFLQEVKLVSTLNLNGPEKQTLVLKLKPAPKRLGGRLVEPTTGDPIIDAQVRILGGGGTTRTDSTGRFELFVDPGSKPGYNGYEPDEGDCRQMTPSSLCYNFAATPAELSAVRQGTQLRWDFGDGVTARGRDTQHCYKNAGRFKVRLQLIKDATGELIQELNTYEFLITDAPRAAFDCPERVDRGTLATFDASASRMPGCVVTDYFWSFSDGFTGYGAQTVHVFEHPGTYKVKLEVTGRGEQPGTFCNACVYRMITVMPRASDATASMDNAQVPMRVTDSQGCLEEERHNHCFSFFDPAGKPAGGDTAYVWKFGDGEEAVGPKVTHCYPVPGLYLVHMRKTDVATYSEDRGEVVFELQVRDTGMIQVEAPLRLAAGQTVAFSKGPLVAKGSNVTTEWDLGDGTILMGEQVQHRYLHAGEYNITVRTSSERELQRQCHTQKLEVAGSLNTADSLALMGGSRNWLDPSQIFYLEISKEGYITQLLPVTPEALSTDAPIDVQAPLDPNLILLEGTVSDDSLGILLDEVVVRVKNRTNGRYQTVVTGRMGSFSLFLDPEHEYEVTAEKGGYLSATQRVSTLQWAQNVRRLNERMRLKRIDFSKTIVLRNIYFAFGSAELLPESREELTKLTGFLRDNPGVSIEVGAHTDSRGNDDFNLILSQARATSVVTFLQDQGIGSSRLQPVGYGEQRPVNRCVNGVECSGDEHKQNRRTEFRILGSKDPIYTEATAEGTAVRIDNPVPQSNVALKDTGVVYSVQVGLFKEPDMQKINAGLGSYKSLLRKEMVNAFTRFRVGYYATFDEAKVHLGKLQTQGFADAFVVAIPKKEAGAFTPAQPKMGVEPFKGQPTEVTTPKPSISTSQATKTVVGLSFKVQIGTFTTEPEKGFFDKLEIWRQSLTAELFDNGKRYMVGPFSNLLQAQDALDDLRRKGFEGCEIVAYHKYRKITLDEARALEGR